MTGSSRGSVLAALVVACTLLLTSTASAANFFGNTVPPNAADTGDRNAVELGIRFSPTVAGYVTGLRFYRASSNAGPHVGHLFAADGTLLASQAFPTATTTGWHEVTLSAPVPVAAGATYVAAYHAPSGNYAWETNGFATPLNGTYLYAPANAGVYRYGAAGGFPDAVWQATNYYVDVEFEPGTDTTPPSVSSVAPADGATAVSTGSSVTAVFQEPVQASTVNAGSFTLRDPAGDPVAATVSYDVATRKATLNPTSALQPSKTYTARVDGVSDLAGNAMSGPHTWSFTTADPPPPSNCPCTLFGSITPPNPAAADNSAIELGVRFRPGRDGVITALRFYKGPGNTGTHTGHLFTTDGQLLTSVTFTGETAAGWQSAPLGTPLRVNAGTRYVAAYHAPTGGYSYEHAAFAQALGSSPLIAPADGDGGRNGVYRYGPAGSFPNESSNSTNYFVDVEFEPVSDATPPTVESILPLHDSTAVTTSATVTAIFSEDLDPATVTTSNFVLRDPAGNTVPTSIAYQAAASRATLTPASLAPRTRYTATVRGGPGGIADVAGNRLAADRTWSFTTSAPRTPIDDGPGGPILVIAKAGSPFGLYYAEILRAEGFNAFDVKDISEVTAGTLAGHSAVLLADMSLTDPQASMLSTWVTGGGDLIAMRPDPRLAALLGITPAGTTLSDAYIQINTGVTGFSGLVSATMQYHGTADRWTLNGATAVATLFSTASASTSNPAVTRRAVGTAGGSAAAFSYDLARSVVYTRQGNPAWAGQERDGLAPRRSDDLFFGAAAGDAQPNWVDLGKVAIPQADEQQRLLGRLLETALADRTPLPRFWYLPRALKAAVVMTGDDHANGGTAGRFDAYRAASTPGCSVTAWDCIRGTSYIYANTPISDNQIAGYEADGFEIGVHVSTGCADASPTQFDGFFASDIAGFTARFPSALTPTTNRTHCIVWSDWASVADTSLRNGIRLDTNYYYWPPSWVADTPGVFTGSGMPMRFAGTDGTMIDVYQATTQMNDESGQTYPQTASTLLSRAVGTQEYFGAFVANMHTDAVASSGSDGILSAARSRNIPVITARQLLTWTDGRNASAYEGLSYANGILRFSVSQGAGGTGLRVMIPRQFEGRTLSGVTRDGSATALDLITVKGVSYGFVPATDGAYEATYAPPPPDTTPPVISAVSAVAATNGTATVTWTTDEESDSRVRYGTSASALSSTRTETARVTAHSVGLTGLTPGTRYFFRVESSDAAGNTAVSPAAASAAAGFGVPRVLAPSSTTIQAGTPGSGTFGALAADDNTVYTVNSTTSGTRTTDWIGNFTGLPPALSAVTVTYSGFNSRSCTQTVSLWRYTNSSWVVLDTRTVATTKATIGPQAPTQAASSFVNAAGQSRVRLRCTTSAGNFTQSADLLRVVYTP